MVFYSILEALVPKNIADPTRQKVKKYLLSSGMLLLEV